MYGRVALFLHSRAAAGEGNISNGIGNLDEDVYGHSEASGVVLEHIMLLLEDLTSDGKEAYSFIAWVSPIFLHLCGTHSAPSADEKAVTAVKLTPT